MYPVDREQEVLSANTYKVLQMLQTQYHIFP